jgi:SpoVK/Ycf46/Vps4 family AAA+-type ATPase
MDVKLSKPYDDIYTLTRLGLAGKRSDVAQYLRQMLRSEHPEEANRELKALLKSYELRSAGLREASPRTPPVDGDSRLQLLREETVDQLPVEPLFAPHMRSAVERFLAQRSQADELNRAGISPANTLLLWGPPGTGKTLTARYIAYQLNLPLLVLDLSSVMSSFLGKTGINIKRVLDYAKTFDCILLLDEFDSIAKRRDDTHELGELKRLVTVLLQEIDEWPGNRILIAATNHPELLDPAIWRRFNVDLRCDNPDQGARADFFRRRLSSDEVSSTVIEYLAEILEDWSYASLDRLILNSRRTVVVEKIEMTRAVLEELAHSGKLKSAQARADLAKRLVLAGINKSEACRIAGISRPTLDKRLKCKETDI